MAQSAVAYSVNGKIIVAPVVRTTTGLGLEVDPTVYPAVATDIAHGMKDALAKSAMIVEHPPQSEWKGFFKPFQDAAETRSHAAFMKVAKSVSICVVDHQIEITPQRNLGSKEGFEPIAGAALFFAIGDEDRAAVAVLQLLN